MPHLLRNSILMILLFCRTLLSCLEAEISVKSILHSKVPLFHTNALTAVSHIVNFSIIMNTYPDRNWVLMIIIILYLLFDQSLSIYPDRNWVFMMFAVSNFLTSLGYPIPYTFVPVKIDLSALDCASNNKITCHNMRIMYSITLHRIMPSNWESTLNKEAQLLE